MYDLRHKKEPFRGDSCQDLCVTFVVKAPHGRWAGLPKAPCPPSKALGSEDRASSSDLRQAPSRAGRVAFQSRESVGCFRGSSKGENGASVRGELIPAQWTSGTILPAWERTVEDRSPTVWTAGRFLVTPDLDVRFATNRTRYIIWEGIGQRPGSGFRDHKILASSGPFYLRPAAIPAAPARVWDLPSPSTSLSVPRRGIGRAT